MINKPELLSCPVVCSSDVALLVWVRMMGVKLFYSYLGKGIDRLVLNRGY